jgi:hypothetical protein
MYFLMKRVENAGDVGRGRSDDGQEGLMCRSRSTGRGRARISRTHERVRWSERGVVWGQSKVKGAKNPPFSAASAKHTPSELGRASECVRGPRAAGGDGATAWGGGGG